MLKTMRSLMVMGALASACVPETDLTNIPGGTDGPGAAGSAAGATLVDPVAGTIDVPLNLAAVTVSSRLP